MGKLFGTDGIRGVANETLDTKLAYRIGQAAAISLQDGTGRKPTVVIGKDTRISSDMLEAALTAGLTACGCNVVTLGVIPTPAVAYLTVQLHADAGAVGKLSGLRVLIDCANGAASATARELFSRFDLDVTILNDEPNGVNINTNCGSTHLGMLQKGVVEGHYDLGIAFDGDADRCLAVDELGREVDGDHIMAICADTLVAQNKLRGGGFVATVMSNIGLHKYCEAEGLRLLCAPVGDRNVLELMQKEGMVLGGEQSGHIIFLDHMTTGDGQLAALQFLSIVQQSGKKVSELSDKIVSYPQILRNVRVNSNAEKTAIMESPALREAIAKAEGELAGNGRVLIRPSGTEPLIRVMVEAGLLDTAERVTGFLTQTVENLQKSLGK